MSAHDDYEGIDPNSLRPGQLCTVLRGFRHSPRSHGRQVAMLPPGSREQYSFWKGWPLRVVYNDRRLPYVLCDVLKGEYFDPNIPGRVSLDKRLAQFIPVDAEYARLYLGQGYQTTL